MWGRDRLGIYRNPPGDMIYNTFHAASRVGVCCYTESFVYGRVNYTASGDA